ncbi:hypothetical protein EV121DRAFT_210893 [Schizophyllum commune]
MLRYVRSGASLAMAHKSFCGVLLILVCFGPLYSAVAAFICIAFKLAEYLHWTDLFWHYLPEVAYWVLPKRVFNYFWPPLRAVPAYVVYDPFTRQYVLVVVDKPGPEHFGPNVGHARFERAPRPQSFRNGAGARPSYGEDDEDDCEEVEPTIVCTRCKRKNPDQRRKPSYCGQCSAPYCSAKVRTLGSLQLSAWLKPGFLYCSALSCTGSSLSSVRSASLTTNLAHSTMHWRRWHLESRTTSREQAQARVLEEARRWERDQAQRRERERAERRDREPAGEEEQSDDDDDDDSAPITFAGGPLLEGMGLPTLDEAMEKLELRAKRQEEKDAAKKQTEAAKQEAEAAKEDAAKKEGLPKKATTVNSSRNHDDMGEARRMPDCRCPRCDPCDCDDCHYAHYPTYRRRGLGV